MPRNAKQYSNEIEELWARADAEGRDLTSGERSHVEELIESAKSMHSLEQQMRELGGAAPSFVTRTTRTTRSRAAGLVMCSSSRPATSGSRMPPAAARAGPRGR